MNWNIAPLGKITTIVSGTTPESVNPSYWNGTHVWVTPTDLGKLNSWIIADSDRRITQAGVKHSNLSIIPKNSVVMSSRAPIGHLAIAGCDLYTNQGCKSFITSDLLEPEFLFLSLRYRMSEIQALGSGSTFSEISKSALEAFHISFPEIENQRRIAALLKAQLAAVEEARQATQAQISDAKRLIPTILEAAFAETINSEFVKIGDAAKTVSGTTPSRSQKDYWEPPKYPWVKTGEVVFNPIIRTEEYISEKALKECSLSVLQPGTVLIAMYGQGKTRGQSALLQVAATTNQACFAILPCEAFDPEYLQFWLRHSYEVLRTQSESRGGNQPNLNGEILNQFTVPLIPRKRQEALANQIKASIEEAERLQSALNQQMNDLELLPAHLLAEAFGES